MPHVRVRPAAPGEGDRLREITTAAKGFWGYDPARVREWTATLDLSPDRLRTAHTYVAEVDGRAVAWAEIVPPARGVCVLEHLSLESWQTRDSGAARTDTYPFTTSLGTSSSYEALRSQVNVILRT